MDQTPFHPFPDPTARSYLMPNAIGQLAAVGMLSYLLGSVPAGWIAGKICHRDLQREGSSNTGATNALRILGKKWGYMVFAVDFLKGIAAITLAEFSEGESRQGWLGPTAALSVIVGHNFPFWLGFRGGKGVATTAGVTLLIFPYPVFVVALTAWGLVFLTTRYVSLASLAASITLPLACFTLFFLGEVDRTFAWTSLGICMLAIWRHRNNISRLISGTEPRFIKREK
ncbi:MAG: glycerol-3-phosphate 1-O-acyltransferase PlsY [Candidatus Xiphinematobacter sp.]|nr:MAG: glycerol-3-phosphate 1-O-acyltransferase PlsY [Candidatus Xiphinematobacter sp.]